MKPTTYSISENPILDIIAETIVHSIYEGLEVMKDENIKEANEAIQDLYTQFIRDFKKNKKNIFMPIHVHTMWKGMYVYLTVDNSEFKATDVPQYRGYYASKGANHYTSINVTVNYIAMQDYPTFREIIFHEMTHHFDDKRGRIPADGADYVLTYITGTDTMVGDIIYRLWVPTERNAYSTKVLDDTPERYKAYINKLSDQIDRIATYEPTDNTENFWKRIGDKLFKGQIKPNTPWTTIRDMFVKKSRVLLSKFEKKCQQRYGQHYANQEITPNMKDLQFKGNHYEDLKTADSIAYTYSLMMRPYEEFVEDLQSKGVKLSNKVMTQIYQKHLRKLIEMVSDDDTPKMKQRLEWAKSQLK